MRESILLFHISDKEVKKKVERALLPLRVRIRHIALKDYSQPLGVLANLPDMTPSEEIYNGEELSDTMIVFCGLSNQKLDQALLALKKSGAGPFPYKAILTPTNQHWLAKDCLAQLPASLYPLFSCETSISFTRRYTRVYFPGQLSSQIPQESP